MMEETQLIPNLFRSEFSKIVSVLSQTFGIGNIQLAEDLTSDTFLVAAETWSLKGVPANPTAWLYSVAKNKARDHFKRQSIYKGKIEPELSSKESSALDIDLSEGNIEDSQLKMLFAICNPALSKEAQITLALRILCGLGIEEIASALLTSKSTINKRLLRAKSAFKKHDVQLVLPEVEELDERMNSVLTIIYLLFNEGYYSSTTENNTKKHLCLEAMSLLFILLQFKTHPEANALMALFCFHASRFEAREDAMGNPILYEDQDPELWNDELIFKGEDYLKRSAIGPKITKYHLEATIAFWHTNKGDQANKWDNILQVYNHLLQLEYSPVAALNRTYALYKVQGKEAAITEALKIDLKDNHLYHALLGDLYNGVDKVKELFHLEKAMGLAKTNSERAVLNGKIDAVKT